MFGRNENASVAQPKRSGWGRRMGMFLSGFGILLFLGFFTIPAFWEHLKMLNPEYLKMSQTGAVSGEFMLFCLLLWVSFSNSIRVRYVALFLTGVLTLVILVHAAALWGLKDGAMRQEKKEQVLKEGLGEMSEKQMGAASGKFKSRNQREIAKSAQRQFADEVNKRNEAIHAASFMPEWYLNGPMYLVLFAAVALAHIVLTLVEFSSPRDSLDRDYDFVPDDEQYRSEKQRAADRQEERYRQTIAEGREWKSPPAEVTVLDNPKSTRVATQERVHLDAHKNPTRVATQRSDDDNWETIERGEDGSIKRRYVGPDAPITKLREHLRVISSYYNKRRFAVDPKPDHLWIRLLRSDGGRESTEASRRYPTEILADVDRPGFRNDLIDSLIRHGFPLEAEKGRE